MHYMGHLYHLCTGLLDFIALIFHWVLSPNGGFAGLLSEWCLTPLRAQGVSRPTPRICKIANFVLRLQASRLT
jgi:hypothetical protein